MCDLAPILALSFPDATLVVNDAICLSGLATRLATNIAIIVNITRRITDATIVIIITVLIDSTASFSSAVKIATYASLKPV